jgi:hypothetical protein
MKARKRSLIAGFIVIGLTIIACTINVGGPAYPSQRIPVSTEAVGDLQNALGTAEAAGIASGQLTVTFTEAQLTSYLVYKLQSRPDLLLTDPQVYLRDGEIQMYATVQRGKLMATVYVAVTAGVDEQGQLKIALSSVDFGPFPVPNALKDAITASIQEAYTGAVGPAATGFRLQSIAIADGTMTIVGQTK